MNFTGAHKNHVLVDCISGLPVYELTTPTIMEDFFVVQEILVVANDTISLQEWTSLGDNVYDVKAINDLVQDVYQGDAMIPLNKCNTRP